MMSETILTKPPYNAPKGSKTGLQFQGIVMGDDTPACDSCCTWASIEVTLYRAGETKPFRLCGTCALALAHMLIKRTT